MSNKNASLVLVLAGGYLPPFLASGAFPPLFCILAFIPLIILRVCGDNEAESKDSQILRTSSGFFSNYLTLAKTKPIFA